MGEKGAYGHAAALDVGQTFVITRAVLVRRPARRIMRLPDKGIKNEERIADHHVNPSVDRDAAPLSEIFGMQALYEDTPRIVADIALHGVQMAAVTGISVMVAIDKNGFYVLFLVFPLKIVPGHRAAGLQCSHNPAEMIFPLDADVDDEVDVIGHYRRVENLDSRIICW